MKTENDYIHKLLENTLLWIACCISLAESVKFIFIENHIVSFHSIISYLPFCLIAGLIFTVTSNTIKTKNKAYLLFNITISWLSSITIIEAINTASTI